eukprot:4433029-Prymnesium_polylepis.1
MASLTSASRSRSTTPPSASATSTSQTPSRSRHARTWRPGSLTRIPRSCMLSLSIPVRFALPAPPVRSVTSHFFSMLAFYGPKQPRPAECCARN